MTYPDVLTIDAVDLPHADIMPHMTTPVKVIAYLSSDAKSFRINVDQNAAYLNFSQAVQLADKLREYIATQSPATPEWERVTGLPTNNSYKPGDTVTYKGKVYVAERYCDGSLSPTEHGKGFEHWKLVE